MTWRTLLAFGLLLGAAIAKRNNKIGKKAASQQLNCGCQCSSLTFRDDWGKVQGICNRADHTGAQWCYVDSWSSACQDLQKSDRFNNPWSYEACSTPPPHLCGNAAFSGQGSGFGGAHVFRMELKAAYIEIRQLDYKRRHKLCKECPESFLTPLWKA